MLIFVNENESGYWDLQNNLTLYNYTHIMFYIVRTLIISLGNVRQEFVSTIAG